MSYAFPGLFAIDPLNPANVATNAEITIFSAADPALTPIALSDSGGLPIPNPMTTNDKGFIGAFWADVDYIGWEASGLVGYEQSFSGIKEQVASAAQSAADSMTEAELSRQAAELAAALVGAPADEAVSNLVSSDSLTREALGSVALVKDTSTLIAGTGAGAAMPDGFNIGTTGTVVALGHNAMANMVDPKKSIAIGTGAQSEGQHTRDNVAIGEDALKYVNAITSDYSTDPSGTRSVAIGGNAGRFTKQGVAHVMIGRNAGQNMVGGSGLVAIGNGAHASRCPVGISGEIEMWAPAQAAGTAAYNVVVIGAWAGSRNLAADTVALGAYALAGNTLSNANVGIGTNALRRVDEKTWLDGTQYVAKNIEGTYSQDGTSLLITATGHGMSVDYVAIFRLNTGGSTSFGGDDVFAKVTAVVDANTFEVFAPKPTVSSGTASLRGYSIPGSTPVRSNENTAVGSGSLAFLDGGGANTFAGANSGRNIKGGSNNVGIGHNSMVGISEAAAINASDNTALGQGTLFKLSDGMTGNTTVGYRAGLNLTTGTNNTFVGRLAGYAKLDSSPLDTATNSTAIGASATISGDNQVQLGNSATTTYVYGTVQNRSDARDKADVRDTVLGLDFINQLRPVDYRWDMRDDYEGATPDGSKKRARYHHGLIAQELQQVIESTGNDFGGLQDHSINGGSDILTVGYDELIAPMIKAIQQVADRVSTLEDSK
ncbi:tail fiber domain-containing protein [Glutamicibacter sp. M10]|uniref:tail fiber domain-containing protein n=1 Tax=Glutamicibacter sp. M10 TaxID=3023076 RepID=UPI0021C63AC4|nr:tail fiber domain-containing protein [Glutamicibacter sp. M10]UXN31018.1 tail fiber domain-containing protein [Glutamicibacter sp. M10]